MTLTSIAFNDLPQYSHWPGILLGATPVPARQRTQEEVLREYDREKWGPVLAWLKARSGVADDDLLRQQGLDPERIIPFARDTQFFKAPTRSVMAAFNQLLLETLQPQKPAKLVELGSGLGEKLLKLTAVLRPQVAYGGEFTASGVECGRLLAKARGLSAHFEHFDYNNPQTLAAVPGDALVYTSHSIEQIPNLSDSFINALITRSPRLVVHFEPCYQDQDDKTLIGLMRRRYIELNDYNRNLVDLLHAHEQDGRIRILQHRKNVFSGTPFNPTSILAWMPVSKSS